MVMPSASVDSAIMDRLAVIEQQNRELLALISSLLPAKAAAHTQICHADPYAVAKQMAREGRRRESVEETKRVSRLLAKQDGGRRKK